MIKKVIKALIISVVSVILTSVLLFYFLIVLGLSPRLQSMWVCTAMTTMNHKYLATWFISEEKIDKIMKENAVDDSDYNSEMTEFEKEEIPPEEILVDPYLEEGYEMLEEGIYLKEVSTSTCRGYVMLIQDPKRVKLRDTKKQYEEGQTVKKMVTEAGAIAGINGGGFIDGANYDSNGGRPAGLVIENSKLISPLSPDDEKVYNMIGLNSDGVLILNHCTAKEALDMEIVSAVSFSPYIVVNGEGTIKNGSGGWGIAPRTAIGQRKSGEILFLVIDGRQIGWSLGCDLDVLQSVMLDEKAENAAMLDGGSSTVLFYNGEYVNKPSLGHERLINNCFIVE